MPKVSIIMPIYNAEKYLKRALDSCIHQTIQDIEIICINDCSKDNSLNILYEYTKKDSRIKIINNEKNIGAGNSRNAGIYLAKGKYLMFLDSDDWLDLTMCEVLYNKAELLNVDLVECATKYYYPSKIGEEIKFGYLKYKENQIYNYKIKKDYPYLPRLSPWGRLYKTEFIKSNEIKFGIGNCFEDQLFTIQVKFLAKISYTDKTFYNYIKNPNSITENSTKDGINSFWYIKKNREFLQKQGLYKENYKSFIKYMFQVLRRGRDKLPSDLVENYNKLLENYLTDYGMKMFLQSCKFAKNIYKIYNFGFFKVKIKNKIKVKKSKPLVNLDNEDKIIQMAFDLKNV